MAKIGGGQPGSRSLKVSRLSSETSADDRKAENKSERKGNAGEMMLATLFYLCPAILKT